MLMMKKMETVDDQHPVRFHGSQGPCGQVASYTSGPGTLPAHQHPIVMWSMHTCMMIIIDHCDQHLLIKMFNELCSSSLQLPWTSMQTSFQQCQPDCAALNNVQ